MLESSVTVIVVNWNGGDMLIQCLSRLTAQSLPPTRILVMDNGSTDGSGKRAAGMHIPDVHVRFLGENLGFAAANNLALDECDTEFAALINPDAFPEPDWLKHLVLAARANPEAASLGSYQFIHGAIDLVDGMGDIYHLSGLVWRNGYGHNRHELNDIDREIFSACAGAALYRCAALDDVGGFDEDFFCYVEDVDLGFRLRLAGYRSLFVHNAVVYHIGSATTGGKRSDFSVYHGHRNLVWAFIKNMPSGLFGILLPLHLLLNFLTIVYFTMTGRGKVILRAKIDAIKGIPHTWQKRRIVQSRRRSSSLEILRALDKRLYLSRSSSRPKSKS